MDGPLGSPAQECLEFGEGVFDWVEVGTVRRQIEQRRSSSLDQRSDAWRLVARQVVHDDDVSRAHLRDENLLDVDLEGVAIDRTVEHERGDQAGTLSVFAEQPGTNLWNQCGRSETGALATDHRIDTNDQSSIAFSSNLALGNGHDQERDAGAL